MKQKEAFGGEFFIESASLCNGQFFLYDLRVMYYTHELNIKNLPKIPSEIGKYVLVIFSVSRWCRLFDECLLYRKKYFYKAFALSDEPAILHGLVAVIKWPQEYL